MITSIIGYLIVGLIVGGLARLIMPGRDPMGCFMTALLGVAGSIIGGLIGRAIFGGGNEGDYTRPGFLWSLLLSLLGALILLFIWRKFSGSRS